MTVSPPSPPAVSQVPSAPTCNSGLFAASPEPIGVARVTKGAPLHLREDTGPTCPQSASCVGASYVVPGDRVMTSQRAGGFTCAFFPNDRGGDAGYVETNRRSAELAATTAAPSAWRGDWRGGGGDHVALRPAGPARLRVDGGAYWPSRQSDRPGGPHFGQMSGYATVDGTVAHYGEPGDPQGCQATLRLVGPYLLVADNQRCGGYNVTFTGVYRVKSNASGRSR